MLSAPSKDSFADLISTLVMLVRGRTSEAQPCWSYIAVKPSMALALKDAILRGGCVTLEDYSTVLEEGLGDTPPPIVRERMARDFGVRRELEEKLVVFSAPQ